MPLPCTEESDFILILPRDFTNCSEFTSPFTSLDSSDSLCLPPCLIPHAWDTFLELGENMEKALGSLTTLYSKSKKLKLTNKCKNCQVGCYALSMRK